MISRGNEQDGNGRMSMPALTGHIDDWAELAMDYLDGRVTPEAKTAIQKHLQQCPACAARLRIQHSVVTYLQETYLDDPPSDLEDRGSRRGPFSLATRDSATQGRAAGMVGYLEQETPTLDSRHCRSGRPFGSSDRLRVGQVR